MAVRTREASVVPQFFQAFVLQGFDTVYVPKAALPFVLKLFFHLIYLLDDAGHKPKP